MRYLFSIADKLPELIGHQHGHSLTTHHNAHVDMDEQMWEDHVSVVHTKEIDTYL